MTAEHVVGTCKPSVLAAVIAQQDPLPRHLLQVQTSRQSALPAQPCQDQQARSLSLPGHSVGSGCTLVSSEARTLMCQCPDSVQR